MIEKQVELIVPKGIMEQWQDIVDILSEMVGIPAALIMRVRENELEVFISSKTEENPYRPGDKEHLWGSGLYCETVIKTQEKLLVANALSDEKWKANPDIKLGMISYLGFPILLPNKKPFGTICVLDAKRNEYSRTVERLMSSLRELIESHLELSYMNQLLGEKNQKFSDYLMELQALRGMVTICSNCKSIKDDQNHWHPIEDYLITHPQADFSHGICPKCFKKLYPEYEGT